jgi:hypothetical protein
MRTTRPIRHFAVAALLCCAALATAASLAVAGTRTTAKRAVAHAALDQACLWQNASASPQLYIREYPSKDAALEPYTISLGGHFFGSDRGHFNDGTYWVELDAGGWANATYLKWLKGGTMTQSYCMD